MLGTVFELGLDNVVGVINDDDEFDNFTILFPIATVALPLLM
jgi:hypothetical protein